MNKKNKESLSNIVVLLCVLVFLISLSILAFGMYNMKKTYEYDSQLSKIENKDSKVAHNLITMLNSRGVIGDSAGLLTASFTGFAFICVLLTLIFQFISSRFQNIFIQKQQFENTFFNMLARQENIISNLKFEKNDDKIYTGRDFFYAAYSLPKENEGYIESLKEELEYHYSNSTWFSSFLQIADNYFCHLYRIIKFVDENKFLTEEEKSNYIDILRAGLSSYEIVMLFYNGLVQKDKKMKGFIDSYALLDHLRYDLLAKKEHIKLYDIKAYGNNELLIQKYNELNGNKK